MRDVFDRKEKSVDCQSIDKEEDDVPDLKVDEYAVVDTDDESKFSAVQSDTTIQPRLLQL